MKLKRNFLIFLVGCVFFFFADAVSASAQFVEKGTASVLSEYSGSETSNSETRHWRISWEVLDNPKASDDSITEIFTVGDEEGAEPICTISLFKDSSRARIDFVGVPGKPPVDGQDGLALAPGFPAPCDFLPIRYQIQNNIIYETKTSAGGRSFLKRYHVSREEISTKAANQKGWVKVSLSPDKDNLHVWTVTDDRGNIVKRQVWVPNGEFWIYEEGPFRKSWRQP